MLWPSGNLVCVALRAVVQDGGLGAEDAEWAIRSEVEDDGTVRLHPLYPTDVPRFVQETWGDGLPTAWGWSLRPDRI